MEQGLTTEEAKKRLSTIGLNTIEASSQFSWVKLLLSQFPTIINAILLFAAVFSLIVGHLIDGFFILAVIVLNGLFGFSQEYRAEKSLEKLKSYTTAHARVIRNGKEIEIKATEIVPGDIIILSEGDRIQADGTLLESHHLEVDEAILTGESLPVIKKKDDQVFRGTLVTKGRARLLVKDTGMQTRFGQIAQSLASITNEKTPLQKQLASLGKILSFIAIGLALLIVPIGIFQGDEIISLVLTAVSIGVAAIPEGLPAVITIALAIGTNRMAKKRAIARKMPAIETLGAVSYLLVDKTGTLTQNVMRVKEVFVTNPTYQNQFLKACLLGNTATLAKKGDGQNFDVIGDRTDGALLLYATNLTQGKNILDDGKIIDEYVFDSETKTVTTVFEEDTKRYIYVRGAPEALLKDSTLSSEETSQLENMIDTYAAQGYRVIAFGSKEEQHKGDLARDHLESKLTFLGIVGIYDPPRPEVKEALAKATSAGITTIMVTGDNELTALAIGKEIGLISDQEDVINGSDLEKMADDDLKEALKTARIFARTKPEDKLRIATLLQSMGFVVGVSGDGVNDALALKKADVGLSMGQSGTDVAKEASDIVLSDDNFATIINAVSEGRTMYNNIVKAITYLLSGNISELLLVLSAAAIGIPAPLLPTQILWINLVTDGLPALALASDNQTPDVLSQKPRNPKEKILNKHRSIVIGSIGIVLTVILLSLYVILLQHVSEVLARTVIFNGLIFSHLCIAVILRSQSLFRINKFLLLTVLLTITLQIIITITPFFQEIFEIGF